MSLISEVSSVQCPRLGLAQAFAHTHGCSPFGSGMAPAGDTQVASAALHALGYCSFTTAAGLDGVGQSQPARTALSPYQQAGRTTATTKPRSPAPVRPSPAPAISTALGDRSIHQCIIHCDNRIGQACVAHERLSNQTVERTSGVDA